MMKINLDELQHRFGDEYVYILNDDGEIEQWDRQLTAMIGEPYEVWIGETWREVIRDVFNDLAPYEDEPTPQMQAKLDNL